MARFVRWFEFHARTLPIQITAATALPIRIKSPISAAAIQDTTLHIESKFPPLPSPSIDALLHPPHQNVLLLHLVQDIPSTAIPL